MAGPSPWPIVAVMDGKDIRIALDLHVDGDALTGRATGADGVEREFCGWLGLMGAIDALVAVPAVPAEYPDEPEAHKAPERS